MTGPQLATADSSLRLIPIDVERDAPLGVAWLNGEAGRDTLRKMGVTDQFNHESNLTAEHERLRVIIDDPNELAWMIELNGAVVGITEVHRNDFEGLPGPNMHIMIGDPAARGHGVGTMVLQTVINYLRVDHHAETIYSRHLTSNTGSAALLQKLGFANHGAVYRDADGLKWQNMTLEQDD